MKPKKAMKPMPSKKESGKVKVADAKARTGKRSRSCGA